MKILLLPRYDRLGASSRLRLYQYIPAFRSAGFIVEVSELFAADYVKALYEKGNRIIPVISAYIRRFMTLLKRRNYDVILLEKEAFPWFPAWFERLMLPWRARLAIDYDDAVFHRYDEHSSRIVRFFLGRKIDSLMRHADMVFAGNDYLAERAKAAGCRNVVFVPTVIDLDRYLLTEKRTDNAKVVIGWIGSPATAGYLKLVSAAVERLQREYSVQFVAIGARADQVQGTPFSSLPWSEKDEVGAILGFDIGIMPLLDAPWERGKCGYKLIQYMACALPVVASPIGVNRQIVKPDSNGFLADTAQDWYDALEKLIRSPELRRRLGQAGRMAVESQYTMQVLAPVLKEELGSNAVTAAHGGK